MVLSRLPENGHIFQVIIFSHRRGLVQYGHRQSSSKTRLQSKRRLPDFAFFTQFHGGFHGLRTCSFFA